MTEISDVAVYGLERAVISSKLPKATKVPDQEYVFESDMNRAKKLGKVPTGTGHDNFLKGITVYFTIKYPQYLTPQLQRYHWIDIISSQSKMHLLHVLSKKDTFNEYVDDEIKAKILQYVDDYNNQEKIDRKYFAYMKLLSNLPMGFEMSMDIVTNYLQLKTIYLQRRNHKLKEDWGAFTDFCEKLPYFKQLIGV